MAAYTNHGSSRGDLGFIPNQRLHAPNRSFFGAPGNLSKKGVALTTTPGKPSDQEQSVREPTSESMVGKRTDWLETQERKLTATLNETRSEQQRLTEQMAIALTTIDRLEEENKKLKHSASLSVDQASQLNASQHWVYGSALKVVWGMNATDDDGDTLAAYKKNPTKLMEVAKKDERLLLSYPMEQVDVEPSRSQLFMRGRFVDADTAQISSKWILVYEKNEDVVHQFVGNFSIA